MNINIIKEPIDLIKDANYLKLPNILYAKYEGFNIDVDTCDIFKNAGIILYKNNKIVMHSEELKPQSVQLIPINDGYSHLYIKSTTSPIHTHSLYLVLEDKKYSNLKSNYQIGDNILRSDDNTAYAIGSFYLKYKEEKEKFDEWFERQKDFVYWKITNIFENLFVEITKESEKVILPINRVTTISELKNDLDKMIENKKQA